MERDILRPKSSLTSTPPETLVQDLGQFQIPIQGLGLMMNNIVYICIYIYCLDGNEILLGCSSQEVFLVKTNLKKSPNCKGSPDLDRSTPRTNDDRQSLASSFHHGLDLICHVML
jgi:hypothetical protein